jgi:hypothetical protein
LKLPKIGRIKIILHRKTRGKIKEVHISNMNIRIDDVPSYVYDEQAFASQCSLAREGIIGIDVAALPTL